MHPGTLRTAAAFALAAAVATGAASPNTIPPYTDPAGAAHWSIDLTDGSDAAERSGVAVDQAGVRLDTTRRPAPGPHPPDLLGLLTLPVRTLDTGTDQVDTVVIGEVPAGTSASVDVRGRRVSGVWTEWLPAEPGGRVTLPEPTTQVQGRLVLTGSAAAGPVVRALDLTAHPAERNRITVAARPVLGYRVFATREGLVGGTTANGHVIGEDDYFVALPSRRALAPRGTGDYSVRVCAPAPSGKRAGGGSRPAATSTPQRCAYAPVWDVGPWNTRDDYWNPTHERQEWKALPQGVPQAQVAHLDGYNNGRDQYDREVLNPAGIDLSDALFSDALGLTDNSWVTVDYLWTGSDPLATVRAGKSVQVHAAPGVTAAVVGTAGEQTRVPVACVINAGGEPWLQIGDAQFLPAAAAAPPPHTPACTGSERTAATDAATGVGRTATGPSGAVGAPTGKTTGPAGLTTELADVRAELDAAAAEVEDARRRYGR